MAIDEEKLLKIKKLLVEVQEDFAKVEEMVCDDGEKIPFKDIGLLGCEKINLPYNVIMTSEVIIELYGLNYLSYKTASNVSYLIQYLQFVDMLVNRFNIYLTLGNVLVYNALVNIYSIYECIFDFLVKKFKDIYKRRDIKIKKKKDGMKKLEGYFYRFFDKCEILDLSKYKKNVLKVEEIRNKIHIILNDKKMWGDVYLTQSFYRKVKEELLEFLVYIKDEIKNLI